ncbi:hypothetical protein [Parvibaculum sp.]|uniref:hypothetical protein n=1 Tax=Parvibaculum sp. TaxID=2024848 RepID=UPI0026309716|nr:hypothetical protein [Parvibaculum sp.]MCW5726227.1 hypothetical protein [Parvibaculum sp.]
MLKWLIAGFGVGLFVLIFIIGAGPAVRPHAPSDITGILKNPDLYDGKMVVVSGTVVNAIGLFGHGTYSLQHEESGPRILVVTGTGVPAEGSVITISGVFRKAATFGNQEYSLIVQDGQ